VLHTVRELEKQAVKLHQGWENALVLAVDSTFPFFCWRPDEPVYQQQPLTRLHFREALQRLACAGGRAGGSLLGALGDPPPLSAMGFSAGRAGALCYRAAASAGKNGGTAKLAGDAPLSGHRLPGAMAAG
jgi:hypothetical protein